MVVGLWPGHSSDPGCIGISISTRHKHNHQLTSPGNLQFKVSLWRKIPNQPPGHITKSHPAMPTTARYLQLGNTLLVMATFAGTLTFSALLTVSTPSESVKSLLGFASALFLGSITGVFPIILSLLRCSDDETPKAVGFVVAGYSIIVALMSAAFLLLMVVLKQYTTIAAFSLGVCLVGVSSTATVGVAIWNSVLRLREAK